MKGLFVHVKKDAHKNETSVLCLFDAIGTCNSTKVYEGWEILQK